MNAFREQSPLLLHSLSKVDALLNPKNVVILGATWFRARRRAS